MGSDILVMMPLLFLLPGLRVNRKEKIALASIFSLSAIVIIVAIIRVVQTSATTQHVDPVWLALWSTIESSVGMTSNQSMSIRSIANHQPTAVMVSCLPSFRILITKRSQSSGGYVHKPSTNGSTPRDRFSHAIRLDPVHQHQREFSDVETLTGDPYSSIDHGIGRGNGLTMGTKSISQNSIPTASQSSIPKGNVRVRNESVSCPRCLWYA